MQRNQRFAYNDKYKPASFVSRSRRDEFWGKTVLYNSIAALAVLAIAYVAMWTVFYLCLTCQQLGVCS